MKKVNFLCLILLGVFFSACNSDDDPEGDWAKSNSYPGGFRSSAVSFKYKNSDGKEMVYVGMGKDGNLTDTDKYLRNFYRFDGKDWVSISANFPALGREGCVAFVIKDIAYVGAGFREKQDKHILATYYSDFYQFDLIKEEWMTTGEGEDKKYITTDIVRNSKIDNNGKPMIVGDDSISAQFLNGIGFELEDKGYVGTGKVDGRISKNIYTYDPQSETWTVQPMKGDPRTGAVVFKIGETVVVCLGNNGQDNVGVETFTVATGWESKAPLVDLSGDWNNDYNQIPRSYAVAFTSDIDGSKGYVAGGDRTNTVWEYRLAEDRWHEVERFANAMQYRVGAVGFSINGVGYITTGGSAYGNADNNTTWKFIPGIDEDDNNDYSTTN